MWVLGAPPHHLRAYPPAGRLADHDGFMASQLIDAVKELILPFIRAADDAVPVRATGRLVADKHGVTRNVLVESQRPEELVKLLALSLPQDEGRGEQGLLQTIQDVLQHSVNTWDQGFLDKLYASTNAVSLPSILCGISHIRRLTWSRSASYLNCSWRS